MLRHATAASVFALATLSVPGGALAYDAVAAPASGTYQAEVFVNSVSGSGCLDKAGFVFVGELSFPGLSGATYALRALETGTNAAIVSSQTLAVKTGKGTTSPSGTFIWNGAGVGGSWNESGTFSGTITEISTHSFVLQLSLKYGSCTEDLNLPLARIGVNQ